MGITFNSRRGRVLAGSLAGGHHVGGNGAIGPCGEGVNLVVGCASLDGGAEGAKEPVEAIVDGVEGLKEVVGTVGCGDESVEGDGASLTG